MALNVNSANRRTLAAIFADPISSQVPWRDIETLVKALGGTVKAGQGSRVHFLLNGKPATFHKPHPGPNTDKGAVRSVRDYLIGAGVKP
jgi:hypothetical protein